MLNDAVIVAITNLTVDPTVAALIAAGGTVLVGVGTILNGRKLKTGNDKTIGRMLHDNTEETTATNRLVVRLSADVNDLRDAFLSHDANPDAHRGLEDVALAFINRQGLPRATLKSDTSNAQEPTK